MKSIFDKEVREEVIRRINSLSMDSQPAWGSMTVGQMVRHCALAEEYYRGKVKVNRSILGRIFGKEAIKEILKDENSTFRRNSPTPGPFKVKEEIQNLAEEKRKWILLVEQYATFDSEEFTHFFFGKMTKTQLGQFIYKHSDHHLKQFGS